MGDPILNLSAWIYRRRKEVGPYADHIVHSVKAYEARITALEEERDRLREALEPFAFLEPEDPEDSTQKAWETIYLDRVKDWIDYEEIAAARAALEGE